MRALELFFLDCFFLGMSRDHHRGGIIDSFTIFCPRVFHCSVLRLRVPLRSHRTVSGAGRPFLLRVQPDVSQSDRSVEASVNTPTFCYRPPLPHHNMLLPPFPCSLFALLHGARAKAMRAVLDRPHRSNFVSVSTAVNRVAKLTAARRRGGGLKGDEEPKYLGVLLKVRVCVAIGGDVDRVFDGVCLAYFGICRHFCGGSASSSR